MAVFSIITDLDGTVLPKPVGRASTSPITEGPAFAPLIQLLELGVRVIAVTGSKLETHGSLFFDRFPIEHRRSGRVLLAVGTARKLYRGRESDGELVEDVDYTNYAATRAPLMDASTVAALVDVGQRGIRRFYEGCATDPSLIGESQHSFLLDYIGSANARDAPVTLDRGHWPRIEVRGSAEAAGAVVFAGVPAEVGSRYFSVPPALSHAISGKPTGRYSFDCIPLGLSKALVIEYLLQTGELHLNAAIALGDEPQGNDEGLTRWHAEGSLPFVAVSPKLEMVPSHLAECHVSSVSHAAASSAVLHSLLQHLRAQQTRTEPLHVTTTDVAAMVRQANAATRAAS